MTGEHSTTRVTTKEGSILRDMEHTGEKVFFPWRDGRAIAAWLADL